MASCEKCWTDAGGDADRYGVLIAMRKEHPCTPEQQAGDDARFCVACERMTVHQYVHVCMNPECPSKQVENAEESE